jgi:hypothetical protein
VPVSTMDLSAGALSPLLLINGLDLTNTTKLVTWLAAHEPKDGLIPVETDSIFGDVLGTPVTDAEGSNPTLLLLSGDNQTLDISNFSNLHAVVLEDAGRTEGGTEHFYTINDTLGTGPKYLTVYLGDLAGETTDPIEVTLNAVGAEGGSSGSEDLADQRPPAPAHSRSPASTASRLHLSSGRLADAGYRPLGLGHRR